MALNELGIDGRLLWDATEDEDGRVIRLSAAGQTEHLMAIPASEFAELSENQIVERFRRLPR